MAILGLRFLQKIRCSVKWLGKKGIKLFATIKGNILVGYFPLKCRKYLRHFMISMFLLLIGFESFQCNFFCPQVEDQVGEITRDTISCLRMVKTLSKENEHLNELKETEVGAVNSQTTCSLMEAMHSAVASLTDKVVYCSVSSQNCQTSL